jgi:hypothetical protein
MEPEDNLDYITVDTGPSSISWVDAITVTPDDTETYSINFDLSDSVYTDISYGVTPEENIPSVYTSYEQREQHEKYPALKKAWEDYLNMYNLTQGDPPIVD